MVRSVYAAGSAAGTAYSSPETREQLIAHYRKQRDTVTTMITESLSDNIDPEDARHIASLLMSVSDGLP
jgi:hypothetical protein